MPIPKVIAGVTYQVPEDNEEGWGAELSKIVVALIDSGLERGSGSFPLTQPLDFGSSNGLLALSLTSKSSSPSLAGFLRLAQSDVINWRNNANNGDVSLSVSSDKIRFNGSELVDLSSSQTLTNKILNSPVNLNPPNVVTPVTTVETNINADDNPTSEWSTANSGTITLNTSSPIDGTQDYALSLNSFTSDSVTSPSLLTFPTDTNFPTRNFTIIFKFANSTNAVNSTVSVGGSDISDTNSMTTLIIANGSGTVSRTFNTTNTGAVTLRFTSVSGSTQINIDDIQLTQEVYNIDFSKRINRIELNSGGICNLTNLVSGSETSILLFNDESGGTTYPLYFDTSTTLRINTNKNFGLMQGESKKHEYYYDGTDLWFIG